jgi:uncharacterized protein
VINAFNSFETRNDIGALWENFIFMERLKKKTYQRLYSNYYFWRTYSKKEIDLIEERDGKLFGFEFKWRDQLYTPPDEWLNNYTNASAELVTLQNFWPFIL